MLPRQLSFEEPLELVQPDSDSELGDGRRSIARKSIAASIGVTVGVFLAIAPLLSRVEFCRTLENLNVATAIEARRDGHWLIPTLDGKPRTKKPPLTAWLTAAAIRQSTLHDMASRYPAIREPADDRLAGEVRLAALLAACAMLAATYVLGSQIDGPRTGACATAVLASSLVFLQHAQLATTDIQLALWVTIANAMVASAVLGEHRWRGCLGGGIAIGIACTCKGPVALVQTVLPLACFLVWRTWVKPTSQPASSRVARWAIPIICGSLLALAVVLPWPLTVLRRSPDQQWRTWLNEVTGNDAPARSEPWFQYLLLFPIALFPWSLFVLVELWAILGHIGRTMACRWMTNAAARTHAAMALTARKPGHAFAMFLILASICVMSAYKDKKLRYLLPVAAPAAVLVAGSIRRLAGEGHRWRLMRRLHWTAVAVIAVGLPVAGGFGIGGATRAGDGGPWYDRATAATAAAAMAALVLLGLRMPRWAGLAGCTLLIMLLTNALFVMGYAKSQPARAPLKALADEIWARYPNAVMYDALPGGERASLDLSIYLNRISRSIDPVRLPSLASRVEPQIAVMLRRGPTSQPVPVAPPGWQLLMQVRRGAEDWFAFVLPPRAGAPDSR
ncbi:MAG: hypothetical protein JWN40_3035 [Phycisphaerales bacterium]|nr:hypothetical protein [Phycisphaerales bacterium]